MRPKMFHRIVRLFSAGKFSSWKTENEVIMKYSLNHTSNTSNHTFIFEFIYSLKSF